jgi:hypothetical protein
VSAALIIAVGALGALSLPASAQSPNTQTNATGGHPKSAYYRKAPQVRGFVQRRGGYSYSSGDVFNTYSNNRSTNNATDAYRNPYLGGQSRSGPFDHGFFFDSGISPRGGNSPYPN